MNDLYAALSQVLGPQGVSDRLIDRLAYAHDTFPPALKRAESAEQPFLPDLVVFPRSTAQVVEVMRAASRQHVPVTPYGGGSGIVGGALAVRGGIVLDTKLLGQIEALDEISQLVTVGAGINGQRLEDALAARGYTLGHYPQSLRSSTVGGWIAHRATGTASTRYGGIEALVSGMEVVLATGKIFQIRPSPRRATGPDLLHLFLGSEGSLGIVTQATLRIRLIPAERRWLVFTFPSFAQGLDAIRLGIQAELRPAVVRLYDEIEAAHLLEAGGIPAGSCLLMLGCEGDFEQVSFESRRLAEIISAAGGQAVPPTPAEVWWNDRFNTRGLLRTLRSPGAVADALEVSGTWKTLPELYQTMRTAMEQALSGAGGSGQVYGHCSHVYPDGGNLYMIFHGQADPGEPVDAVYERVLEAAFRACLAAGGNLSHHHGIGLGKNRWLEAELGPVGLEALRRIRSALDPDGLLNPGKLGNMDHA